MNRDGRLLEGYAVSFKEKTVSFFCLLLLCVIFRFMLNEVLLTFIMVFVFYHLNRVIQNALLRTFGRGIADPIVYTTIYVVFISFIGAVSYTYMPKIIAQMVAIGRIFINYDVSSLREIFNDRIYELLLSFDFRFVLQRAGQLLIDGITNVSIMGFSLFISLILSYFILLEQKKIKIFGEKFKSSKIGYVYDYFIYFGSNFVQTFGKVMKVQVTIATINAVVSTLILWVLGFPQILGLGIMIFGLGLIPVAGVIISLIPLSLIAFQLGGLPKLILVIGLIALIHAIEAYVLNPKLMSNKTRLPVCFTFIILLVAERYLGVWGLLIGIPLFMFVLAIAGVPMSDEGEKANV